MARSKRVVALGDFHCGHVAGLAPPGWHVQKDTFPKIGGLQREMWDWYKKTLAALQPIDILFDLGDNVDGKGPKSGGTELLTADRHEQVGMAAICLREAKAKKLIMVRGTGYHVGKEEDWEDVLAEEMGADDIGDHSWPEVNGLVFDLKHRVGGSSIPHGRFTTLARESLWNLVWGDELDGQPRADIFLRGHVHYHVWCGAPRHMSMILPALQAPFTKFGARHCSGTVHFGFVSFDIKSKGEWTWRSHLLALEGAKARVLHL